MKREIELTEIFTDKEMEMKAHGRDQDKERSLRTNF